MAYRTQRNILLTRLPVCYKRIWLRKSLVVEMLRARYGERAQSFQGLWVHDSPCSPVFTNLEALQTPSIWVFIEASLHQHDWLNHWPPAIDLTSSPSSLLRGHGGEGGTQLNGQTFQSPVTWLLLLATSPHPQVQSQNHLINITKDTFVALIPGNCKGFRSSVPGTEQKPHIFHYISQYHTHKKKKKTF